MKNGVKKKGAVKNGMANGCCSKERFALIAPYVAQALTTDEIYARLPPGSFRNRHLLASVISNLRKAGRLPPNPRLGGGVPWRFSLSTMGEGLWRGLVAESAARHMTPFDLARTILTVIFAEPTLLKNLLDEFEDREAAE